jgi:hypothetical protein
MDKEDMMRMVEFIFLLEEAHRTIVNTLYSEINRLEQENELLRNELLKPKTEEHDVGFKGGHDGSAKN